MNPERVFSKEKSVSRGNTNWFKWYLLIKQDKNFKVSITFSNLEVSFGGMEEEMKNEWEVGLWHHVQTACPWEIEMQGNPGETWWVSRGLWFIYLLFWGVPSFFFFWLFSFPFFFNFKLFILYCGIADKQYCVSLRWTVGEGNGTPLQYSCLENPIDGGARWAAVHGVAKSRTTLSDFTFTFHFHAKGVSYTYICIHLTSAI